MWEDGASVKQLTEFLVKIIRISLLFIIYHFFHINDKLNV